MKKNVLSLSIAAVIGSLGLSGAALAGVAYQATDVAAAGTGASTALTAALPSFAATNAGAMAVNPAGIGHNLLVPYYTVQEGNATLLSIVNTDTRNGKAVKVRFRGASNSDDVFDFTLFLSPSDVWVAHVSKDATTGKAQIYTPDNSCTLPRRATLNATKFVTDRVYGATDADKAAETLEGYVEIFNMADIPPQLPADANDAVSGNAGVKLIANPLFTAIKHTSAGTNPCGLAASDAALPAALTKLSADPVVTGTDDAVRTNVLSHGLWAPTTGLTGSWTILNVMGASVAWSDNMTAIEARVGGATAAINAAAALTGATAAQVATAANGAIADADRPARGRVVFSPQRGDTVAVGSVNTLTADPLLRNTGTAPTTAIVEAAQYDLPDMSTPYLTSAVLQVGTGADANSAPGEQARLLTAALAAKNVINEYVTNPNISAATDWVFSMPTRRYAVGVDYKKVKTSSTPLVFNVAGIAAAGTNLAASTYFTTANTSMSATTAHQACVQPGGSVTAYDQEEGQASGEFVISPGTVKKVAFCGETSILTFNGTSALKAKLATKDIDAGFVNGWLNIGTSGLNNLGLPIVGSSFVKMTGPLVAGKSTNFSITQTHRFIK